MEQVREDRDPEQVEVWGEEAAVAVWAAANRDQAPAAIVFVRPAEQLSLISAASHAIKWNVRNVAPS